MPKKTLLKLEKHLYIFSFISNPEVITLPHYNEVYIAYAKAAQKVDCGYEDHIA